MKRQNGSRFLNVFSLHAGRNLQKHYPHDNPILVVLVRCSSTNRPQGIHRYVGFVKAGLCKIRNRWRSGIKLN